MFSEALCLICRYAVRSLLLIAVHYLFQNTLASDMLNLIYLSDMFNFQI